VPGSAHTKAKPVDAEIAQVDADLASELIASGVTTQPAETVIAVLEAHRSGASINAAAKASGINYRTAQRIVEGAAEHRHRQLVAADDFEPPERWRSRGGAGNRLSSCQVVMLN
jgi:hypothetical protein